jgi:hypothetical protein
MSELVVTVQVRVPAAAWREHRTAAAVLDPAADFTAWATELLADAFAVDLTAHRAGVVVTADDAPAG